MMACITSMPLEISPRTTFNKKIKVIKNETFDFFYICIIEEWKSNISYDKLGIIGIPYM
jgi:hypothetical protein